MINLHIAVSIYLGDFYKALQDVIKYATWNIISIAEFT